MGNTTTLWIAAACGILCLAGCDPIYGVSGSQLASQPPDASCIAAAIRATPGVTSFEEKTRVKEGWLLTGSGPSHGSPIHYFTYGVGGDFHPTLMVEENDDRFSYSNYMWQMGRKIPQPEIDRVLPIMRGVERHVADTCGIKLDGKIKYRCVGATCSD